MSRKGRSMQRKVAYVFLYKNGIRERSVGILRRYGTANQPEVALELFGEEVRRRKWKIYYFTKGEALAEAVYLWGTTAERGKSEVRLSQCRLCTEAGTGNGVVLLPERADVSVGEQTSRNAQNAGTEPADRLAKAGVNRPVHHAELREYLCARYDGKEVSEEELWAAFHRKAEPEPEENPCIESAKKLMEEIARAAGGDTGAEGPGMGNEPEGLSLVQLPEEGESVPRRRKRRIQHGSAYLEELLLLKPPYVPCRRYDVEYSVRITPEDLLHLPKEGKQFAENSYLLHGYYRYRHVLLGRRRRSETEDYVLLVPGIYNEKEARVARLFGFSEFLPVKAVARSKPEAREKICEAEQNLQGEIRAEKIPETGSAASGKELFGYFCGKI